MQEDIRFKTDEHEHDRFLFEKEGFLHFGCINPFCGHGDPALPHHWKIPMDTRDFSVSSITHKDRKLSFTVVPKRDGANVKAGASITIIADDNLESCKNEFKKKIGA